MILIRHEPVVVTFLTSYKVFVTPGLILVVFLQSLVDMGQLGSHKATLCFLVSALLQQTSVLSVVIEGHAFCTCVCFVVNLAV